MMLWMNREADREAVNPEEGLEEGREIEAFLEEEVDLPEEQVCLEANHEANPEVIEIRGTAEFLEEEVDSEAIQETGVLPEIKVGLLEKEEVHQEDSREEAQEEARDKDREKAREEVHQEDSREEDRKEVQGGDREEVQGEVREEAQWEDAKL